MKTNQHNGWSAAVLSVALLAVTVCSADFVGEKVNLVYDELIQTKTVISSYTAEPLKTGTAPYDFTGFSAGKVETTESITDTPADIKALMEAAKPLYETYKHTGSLQEIQLGSSTEKNRYGKVSVNNKTDSHSVNVKSELSKTPSFGEITKEKPYILIYHTHTTEGYEMLDMGWYSDEYNSRTTDTAKTVVRVGDAIAEQLEKAGYGVIHDKTVYDRTYNGAYSRSLVTVEKYLKEYPSIVITLDVHRDAIHYDSGTKCKPTAVINGKKAAQVMIITGCEEGDITDYGDWQKNLTFSVALQNAVEEKYEGLMRPVFFCARK